MMFVQSLHGISHNKIEDTREEHLEMCVTAFDRLAEVFKECVRVQAPTRTPDIDTRNRLPFIKGYESELDILRVDQCMAEQHYRGSYIPYVIAP